jgi:hypothetical protein
MAHHAEPPAEFAPVSTSLAAIETGAGTTGCEAQRRELDNTIYPARAIGDIAQDVLFGLVAQGVRPSMASTVAGLAFGGDA